MVLAGACPTFALRAMIKETASECTPERLAVMRGLVPKLIDLGASPNALPKLARTCCGNENFEPIAEVLLWGAGNPRLDGDHLHSVYLEVSAD